MINRKITVYIASGFIVLSLLLALYFFVRKPETISAPNFDAEKRAIIFKDVVYAGEKEGIVDWEIRAKSATKYLDKPVIEMKDIKGLYKPKPDVTVLFSGTQSTLNTNEEKGTVADVKITYRNEYTLISSSMGFDFKKGITTTKEPVDIKGTKLTLKGIGLYADTNRQMVTIERDVTGFIDAGKGRYKFSSDRFTYFLKDDLYVLEGKVIFKGEKSTLLCDRISIRSTDGTMERIDAKGKVQLIAQGGIAKSGKAVYDFREDKVVLTDSPRIVRNNVEMEGTSIIYNVSSGKFMVESPKMRIERK